MLQEYEKDSLAERAGLVQRRRVRWGETKVERTRRASAWRLQPLLSRRCFALRDVQKGYKIGTKRVQDGYVTYGEAGYNQDSG